MPRGKAQFSGESQIKVGDFDKEVADAVHKVIPGLFEEIENEHGITELVEHPDFVGVLSELQGAAWLAKRMISEGEIENSVPDVRAELSKLLRWIERGEIKKLDDSFESISPDVWWFLKTSLNTGLAQESIQHETLNLDIYELREAIVTALASDITARQKPSETNYSAANTMVQMIRNALLPHQESLAVTLTAYCSPDYGNSSTLVQLVEAIGSAIHLHLSKLRWRNIAQEVISENKNGVDDGAI
jgi:hypothetical protein